MSVIFVYTIFKISAQNINWVILMSLMRKLTKALFFAFLFCSIMVFSAIIYLNNSVCENYKIKIGEVFEIDTPIPITAVYNNEKILATSFRAAGEEFEVKLKVFGVIPFSTVNLEIVDDQQVAVLGNPFGMKLYTDGVLAVEFSEVSSENGSFSPAKLAGIEIGDYIISVNGIKVHTNEELSLAVEESKGKEMKFLINRNGNNKIIKLKGALSKESGIYKIGLWVRDSSAGIGTLTFYSPSANVICGLGHGICDEDTGDILKLESGEIVTADIISVKKGKDGETGELVGKLSYKSLGKIDLNCEMGVYSILDEKINITSLTEIALKQEVCDGYAQILCTVEGDEPKLYDCKIKVKNSSIKAKTQNLVVTVVDEELLSLTGGIVQGMSGSPLLQNGKLIGAVTHVLVDDPTKGYAIFAENMLETAQSVAEQQLKGAS